MTSRHNHNMIHALTTYPTHPKFGTAITNNLNQKTTPQVRQTVIVVIHVHENKYMYATNNLQPTTPH